MAACDLCGATVPASTLQQLRTQYQIQGVVDLCSPCSKWADGTKDKLMAETAPAMRAAILDRKKGCTVNAPVFSRLRAWIGC